MQVQNSKLPVTQQNYRTEIKREFTTFIQSFKATNGDRKYEILAKNAINASKHHIMFSFTDLLHYNHELANLIFQEYYKYEPIINEALTQFMNQYEKGMNQIEVRKEDDVKENYQCSFDDGFNQISDLSVRGLKCSLLGKLIKLRGTVTRTSEVRPQLKTGVFKCRTCGKLSRPIIQQFKYTEPKRCTTNNCDRSSWELQMSQCQFADFQKIRMQQDPSKIPPGAMPRSIDVILRNQFTEKGQPGDICEVIGYLCVLPELSSMLKPGEKTQLTTRSVQTRGIANTEGGISGLKGVRDLSYKLIFTAINIRVQNNQFDQFYEQEEAEMEKDKDAPKQAYEQSRIWQKVYSGLTHTKMDVITRMRQNTRLYDDMAESLFPTIYGHQEIKKALLLQLIGGIHKRTQNKINIRGDINILIVGDPSSAKSQFLKCINKFVPRSVYTNGKTTSAAGLTASVTRDESGNVGIEAGALMLADNGICCIDEFDKMETKDQVAIHEAMEQQTISIAKAGVYATLNARTSILAAANPIFGRYDKSKSLKNNIQLSAPIMSRFDLFFVVCDQSNSVADQHLSEFIINIHRYKQPSTPPRYNMKDLKDYLSVCRKIKPQLTLQSAELLRKFYIEIRGRDKNSSNNYRITVRQLQSMIRLSEAYARLQNSLVVHPKHVKEAHRLLSCSILKLQKPNIDLQQNEMQDINAGVNRINIRDQKLDQIKRKKEEQQKSKSLTISHELYQSIQKDVQMLFKEKRQMHKKNQIEQEEQFTQQDLCDVLISKQFDRGTFTSMEESEQMKKLINAVIKKFIREERMLMIAEDHNDLSKRMIQMHPNYVEQ